MRTLVFLTEERSMCVLIDAYLAQFKPDDLRVVCVPFEGKQDLERHVTRRLRGWLGEHARFFVIRDQDSGDCKAIKARLKQKCDESGRSGAVVRIACRQMESWFVGDWRAVAMAFGQERLANLDRKSKYRDPDIIGDPYHELRSHITGYGKIQGARAIAPLLDPSRNRSTSFRAFDSVVRKAMSEHW